MLALKYHHIECYTVWEIKQRSCTNSSQNKTQILPLLQKPVINWDNPQRNPKNPKLYPTQETNPEARYSQQYETVFPLRTSYNRHLPTSNSYQSKSKRHPIPHNRGGIRTVENQNFNNRSRLHFYTTWHGALYYRRWFQRRVWNNLRRN